MRYPIKNIIYEKLIENNNTTDLELLKELEKSGYKITIDELNNELMNMEIKGLLTTRWQTKNKRRIEIIKQEIKEDTEEMG
tara:strand:+ start:283 stop:525 length:243 start_codon:yes stop_codon:yes gene_type:complete